MVRSSLPPPQILKQEFKVSIVEAKWKSSVILNVRNPETKRKKLSVVSELAFKVACLYKKRMV